MFEWLDTLAEPPDTPPPDTGQDSGEIRGSPVFPVSRFRKTPSRFANRPETRMDKGFPVFPVFPVFFWGGPEGNDHACEKNSAGIPEHHPELLDATAAFLTRQEWDELRQRSRTEPEEVAGLCRLILAAPPFPTPEEVAELDALMGRLCELEPWLAGYLPEMQAARRRMAPVDMADNLARFRQWVREAEARAARPAGGWCGDHSAP